MKKLRKRWRQFEVRIQKNERVQGALQSLYARYIGFVYRTTRWEKIGFESYEADIARGVPRVLCTWHDNLALITYLRRWDDHRMTVLASRHADAHLVFKDLHRRDVKIILLATSRANGGGLRDAVRLLRQGESVGVTVDGPLGPPRVAKPGAIVIAGLAGVLAAPCYCKVSRNFRLKTWDRFIIPLPWSRGVFAIGDGFVPPKRQTEEALESSTRHMQTLIAEIVEVCEERLNVPSDRFSGERPRAR